MFSLLFVPSHPPPPLSLSLSLFLGRVQPHRGSLGGGTVLTIKGPNTASGPQGRVVAVGKSADGIQTHAPGTRVNDVHVSASSGRTVSTVSSPPIFNTASLTYLDGSAVHATRNRRTDNLQTHAPHSTLEIDFTFKGTAYSFNAGGYRLSFVKASQPPFSTVS
jgi:hypothetical protein